MVGLGIYALERLPRPAARQCLERVVDRLAELAERRDGLAAWFSPPERLASFLRDAYPDGLYNLGASHGVAGIVTLLAAACRAGASAALAGPLLEGAVVWLLARRLHNAGIVDVAWSLNFLPLAILFAVLGTGDPSRRIAVVAGVAAWSLRLGLHLWARVAREHPREDARYAALREKWGASAERRLLLFFQFNQHRSGTGMARHVRQRFLADSKYGCRLLRFQL